MNKVPLKHRRRTHYTIVMNHLRLPFMVESVPTVDGSNIFGVIEEVRANCALRSDRHLMLLSDLSVVKIK